MLTRETAIATAQQFVLSCKKNNIDFSNVILFGSVVTGNTNEYSDIDLLLVSDKFTTDNWENAKVIAPINKHFSMIDAHTFSTEYYKKGDPLINAIKKTGIALQVH